MPFLPFLSIFLILFFLVSNKTTAAHICSKPSTEAEILCPPFTSFPTFPFSSSPGCGHPSFQIQCSPSHAIISINNFTFSLVHYELNSSTLLLSPQESDFNNCSFSRSISLSGSPFKVSDSSCSRLSALKPCPPPNLPNCSHCPMQCKLIKNPLLLLHECGSRHHFDSDERCQSDILGFLDDFLKMGIEVEYDEDQDSYFSSCKTCRANNGACGFNSSHPKKPFLCFPLSQVRYSPPLIRQKSANHVVMLSMLFLLVCFLVVFSIGTFIFRSRQKGSGSEEDPTIIYLRRHRSASLLPPVFPYEELENSTNHFDPKRKLGDGGFGSVYLGNLEDGRLVAVKHLHKHSPAGAKAFSTKSFCNEILILSSINHPNLVKLHGYCSDPRGLLLVYDYVPNGTLADHLHGNKNLYKKGCLTWSFRVDIALQIAMAIEYLHFSVVPPIVHRDITSTNIFVEKDMRVKVGDFGLSRLLVCTDATVASGDSTGEVWTGPQGTPGYLDPDYHKSFRLNEKSDIYSFGVVLLELITGMKAVDQKREKREMALADMVVSRIQMGLLQQVVDPVLVVDGEAIEGVGAVAELAFRCVAADKDDRPDSRDVVAELRRIRGRARGVGSGGGILRTSNSSNMVVPDGLGLID
uniref:LEAF RUST 10 DISEASE-RESISTANCEUS RECEPTOR-LIKE PROTEIN KINASE-like 1.5 n=1 Tax=Nicotiana tabacum TaxID=4097 RepID=A0A1S4BKK4_TOBAC|nr:PREDICTED: LEAF RUST 10 DISEASE-RESISTANCE LOCUS RECEPTOR-LIKE PROTEIN KINASE-like 1.5 [Nicotiana tabacum]